MVRIRKILCPVDFFGPSETALSYAVSLAKSIRVPLRILHVIPPVTSIVDLSQDSGKLVKALHEDSNARLAGMAKTVKALGVNASVEVRFGEIDHEILEAVRESKADLLVAGTHGRRGFQHWLLGSVCERLLRSVSVPMLAARGGRERTGIPTIKRILIGIDFTDESKEAASWGFSIAEQCRANVTLMHVADFVAGDVPVHYRSALLEGIRLELAKLIPSNFSCETKPRVEFGLPPQSMLSVAKRDNTDLIVVGTHGKSVLDRTLLGQWHSLKPQMHLSNVG